MHTLTNSPHDTYRRVELDARIEASDASDLTRICLEEAVDALGQAVLTLERDPSHAPGAALSRAHSILLWLTRAIAPDNPLREQLRQFYGGLAATVRQNMRKASSAELAQARTDLADLLTAAQQS